MKPIKSLITLSLLLYSLLSSAVSPISPFDYGLREARNDIERYLVLLRSHQEALRVNTVVDYSGIGELHIEVPIGSPSIPVGKNTDFKGLHLFVTNGQKNTYVFQYAQKPKLFDISKTEFLSGTYLKAKGLTHGTHLLIVEDASPWGDNREGKSYSAIRKDILLIKDGIAKNSPTFSYSSAPSNPKFSIVTVDEGGSFKNLSYYRTAESTAISFPICIEGINKFLLENIKIFTPESTLFNDSAILIKNCSNITLNNIYINGTYSLVNQSGYGIRMENVWNTTITNMHAVANWGVFGCNNVNRCSLKHCSINRFDIHCYGRDITMEDCYFKGMYNQYSSVFGTIIHKDCVFDDQRPVLIESSYNAYTGFDIVFDNCTFKMTPTKNEVVYLMTVPQKINSRQELSQKCLPNVIIKRCSFIFPDNLKEWYIYRAGGNSACENYDYVSTIEIIGAKMSKGVKCQVSNIDFTTKNAIKYHIKRWAVPNDFDYKQETVKNLTQWSIEHK